MILEF
jgi:uncharacterized protein YjbI with pentapeptide repeats